MIKQKDLPSRWGCSIRTAKRRVKQFKMRPVTFEGQQPLFDEKDCNRVMKQIDAVKARKLGYRLKGGKR